MPPPVASLPADWQYATGADGGEAPDAGWWRTFEDAELERLVRQALESNTDLRAAASRIEQAAAAARAAGAGLYPEITVFTGASRSDQPMVSVDARDSFDALFSASYELDLWGRNRALALSAEAIEAATRFDRETVAITLQADVATIYFQYLALSDRIVIAEETIANARQVLRFIETQARFGAASPLELAQQRSAVASLEATLPNLRQQRAQTANAIALLTGATPGAVELASRTVDGFVLPSVAPGLPIELLTRRPDIRRAEAELVAANADVAAARAALLPSITLVGQGGVASSAFSSLLDSGSLIYTVAADLVAPIFDGGRLRAERERSEARYEELIEAYRGAILNALRDVEDALAASRYLTEAETAQGEAAAQAREAYRLAREQHRAGSVDLLTVLQTQRAQFDAEEALVGTRLARLTAAATLFRALGGGWSPPPSDRYSQSWSHLSNGVERAFVSTPEETPAAAGILTRLH